jgi:TolB-like protein/Tfp pilus assembly protein PilF
MDFRSLVAELKRRNVFRVATAYAIAGWLIIQICATTFPFLKLPEWLITAVIVFVLIGFPLSIIFAWAFELTPEGLKKSQEVDITESVTSRTGKKLNGIIITVLSMAVIFLLVERVFFAEAAFIQNQSEIEFETASIAVLPFVDMSAGQDQEYFSDGLSEELLNALAKVEDMKVAGRTSSFKFKGQNENLKLIGDELNVQHILEGSVRKSGSRIRITAQLIKADDGFHLWSETFDRELTANNVFEIQEEISRKVLDELKVRLLPEEDLELNNIPTQDIEAYQAYLKGNQLLINRNYAEIEAAIALYQDAIRIDPSFAEAHGQLALAYNAQAYYGNIPRDEYLENLKSNAERALSINEYSPSANAALGLYYQDINDLQKAEEQFKRSLEQNPNFVDVYNWLGNLYQDLGDRKNQFSLYEKGYEIDPLNPLAIYNRTRVSVENEDYEEMEFFMDKNIRINPDFIPTYFLKGNIQMGAPFGNLDEAGKYLIQVYNSDNDFPRAMSLLVFTSQTLGIPNMADYFYEILKDSYRESFEFRVTIGFYESTKRSYSDYPAIQLTFLDENSVIPQDQFSYTDFLDYALETENYERVLPYFRKFDEDLFSDTLSVLTAQNKDQAWPLAYLLQKTGNKEQSEKITKAFCEFTERSKESYLKREEDVRYQGDLLVCSLLKRDQAAIDENLTILYEKNSDLISTYYWLRNINRYDSELYSENLKILQETVDAELEQQRENFISYLKENGDWKEEWGEGN